MSSCAKIALSKKAWCWGLRSIRVGFLEQRVELLTSRDMTAFMTPIGLVRATTLPMGSHQFCRGIRASDESNTGGSNS